MWSAWGPLLPGSCLYLSPVQYASLGSLNSYCDPKPREGRVELQDKKTSSTAFSFNNLSYWGCALSWLGLPLQLGQVPAFSCLPLPWPHSVKKHCPMLLQMCPWGYSPIVEWVSLCGISFHVLSRGASVTVVFSFSSFLQVQARSPSICFSIAPCGVHLFSLLSTNGN